MVRGGASTFSLGPETNSVQPHSRHKSHQTGKAGEAMGDQGRVGLDCPFEWHRGSHQVCEGVEIPKGIETNLHLGGFNSTHEMLRNG